MTSPNVNDPGVVEALERIKGQLETLQLLRGKAPDPIEPARGKALNDQRDMSQRLRGVDLDYFKAGRRLKTDDIIRRTNNVDLYALRKNVEGQIRKVDLL